MSLLRPLTVVVLLAALASRGTGASAQAPDGPRRYELANFDTLELTLPAGWRDQYTPADESGPPLIQVTDAGGTAFAIEILPEWADPVTDEVPDAESLRASVRAAAERVRAQSLESSFEIRRLQGANGIGFYYRATEREPEAGEFRCMTEGALQLGRLTLWFTILTPTHGDRAIEQALAMLGTAAHRGTGLDQH